MKSIVYIVPYFGKLPALFSLWLKSCECNPTIDWFLYIDDRSDYEYPPNVKVHYVSFGEMKKHIQAVFPFHIELFHPYRLCDYRPAYGKIFAKDIKNYDFWGFCDVDLIFGNIRTFLKDEILEAYDKIGYLGHSTLFRNIDKMNSLYEQSLAGKLLYKDIFTDTSGRSRFFDEKGINQLCEQHNIKVYKETIFADLTPLTWNFQINYGSELEIRKNEHRLFVCDRGKLYSYSLLGRSVCKDEFMYVHFLRRRIKIEKDIHDIGKFLIIPNKIVELPQEITMQLIKKYSKNRRLCYWIDLFMAKRGKMSVQNIISYFRIRRKAMKKFNDKKLNNTENYD